MANLDHLLKSTTPVKNSLTLSKLSLANLWCWKNYHLILRRQPQDQILYIEPYYPIFFQNVEVLPS